MQRDIRIKRRLPFPVDHVWRALSDRHALGRWFMESDFEPRLRHAFTFRMKPQPGWDGLTHCEVIELDPPRAVAFTYRGAATGEKPLACAGVDSRRADAALEGTFVELDTVLRFTLTPERGDDGAETTRLVMEHTGFRGFKLVLVSLVMDLGWRRVLRRLPPVLEAMALGDASPAPSHACGAPTRA